MVNSCRRNVLKEGWFTDSTYGVYTMLQAPVCTLVFNPVMGTFMCSTYSLAQLVPADVQLAVAFSSSFLVLLLKEEKTTPLWNITAILCLFEKASSKEIERHSKQRCGAFRP